MLHSKNLSRMRRIVSGQGDMDSVPAARFYLMTWWAPSRRREMNVGVTFTEEWWYNGMSKIDEDRMLKSNRRRMTKETEQEFWADSRLSAR